MAICQPRGLIKFTQVFSGLAYAHQNNIAHRDLKPSNIMLCKNSAENTVAKIIDFGIARQLAPQAPENALTRTNALLGSPPYISPEQCRGQRGDRQSDIYSLGCIMYECLSGKQPYSGETAMEVMYKHLSSPVPRLSAIAGTEPGKRLAALVERCLEKEPSGRPQSMEELSLELSQIGQSAARFASFCRDKRLSVVAKVTILALLLLSLAGMSVFLYFHGTKTRQILPAATVVLAEKDAHGDLRDEIKRIRKSLSRSMSCFEKLSGTERADSETTLTLLNELQHLSRVLMQSGRKEELEEAVITCTRELAVSRSVKNKGRTAAGYALKGQAESMLGNFKQASQDFAECQKIVLSEWGQGSSAWQDYTLYAAMFNLRRGNFKEAENELSSLFKFWLVFDDTNPKKMVNQAQFLDPQGPDRSRLVINCLRTLEQAKLSQPADAAAALSIANLLTDQLFDFKESSAGRESIQLSRGLLARLPSGHDSLKAETENRIRLHSRM